jgi:hypothetical protein
MEGDTPSFLGLVNNGLSSPENPDYGSWGGRYEFYIPAFKKYMHEPETRPIWTNADDEVFSTITQAYHTSNQATIWRWREAYQNDFAARIDWSNSPNYGAANHPPLAKLDHPNKLTVVSGDEVVLSGAPSSDPDGDSLKFQWIVYKEASSLNLDLRSFWLEQADTSTASFTAPETNKAKTIHLILQVSDEGIPQLTRYQRVIVNVLPEME